MAEQEIMLMQPQMSVKRPAQAAIDGLQSLQPNSDIKVYEQQKSD